MKAAVLPAFLVLSIAIPKPPAPFDLIFAGGRVVDGTGAPWFRADVGIRGDRIGVIGDLSRAPAKRRVDASRMAIAPGFIDMLGQSEYNVLVDNRAASKITQGITTEITGEGQSIAPLARLQDPATRARVRADFPRENPDWNDEPGSRILITMVLKPDLKKYEGKTIAEIARTEKKDPLDVLMDLVIADRANVGRVTFSMSEDDVCTALAHPLVLMGTDSGARAEDGIFSQEKSHPRAWGSAARILGHYVRDEKLLTLEEAVRKMTSLPASRMGLADRGILRPGMAADITAFDPATVRERSTYADPLHYSEGIPFVCVNGQLVVDGGRITEARPGRALKGPGYRKGDTQ